MEFLTSDISQEWLKILLPGLENCYNAVLTASGGLSNVTPSVNKWLECARVTPLDKIKIVIIGQDPYPTKGASHGLAFSCLNNLPPTLTNIHGAIVKSKAAILNISEIAERQFGDLSAWAKQGVLLLNCALTTEINTSGAHMGIWRDYTSRIIKEISEIPRASPIIFMLWGNHAKSLKQIISEKCIIMEYLHPSMQNGKKFLKCDHFVRANEILAESKQQGVDWDPLCFEEKKIELEWVSSYGFDNKTIAIFTDGSCWPNRNNAPDAKAGAAVIIAYGPEEESVYLYNLPSPSNIRAEGEAIYISFEIIEKHMNVLDKAIIITDSEYWINMLTKYVPNALKTGESIERYKNPELVNRVYYKMLDVEKKVDVSLRHIKSHGKSGWRDYPADSYEFFCYYYNRCADKYANTARLELKVGEKKKIRL
jgi:uracil-DNA glycosylase